MVGASVHAGEAADQHLDLGGSLFDPWRTGTAMRDCAILFRVCVTRYPRSTCSDLIRIGLICAYSLSCYRDIVRAFAESRPRWAVTPIAPDPSAIEWTYPIGLDD
jgi:hypothetical protein